MKLLILLKLLVFNLFGLLSGRQEEIENQEEVDIQKSLDENLAEMNDLLKSKKTLSKEDVAEYMKNPKNKNLFKEYMKGEDEEEEEEEDDNEDEEKKEKMRSKKMKKSYDNLVDDEIVDAVPVLKSFIDIFQNFDKRLHKIEKSTSDLQKSIEDNLDLQKSFGNVLKSQAELIKSMNDEIEIIGSQPAPVKGIVNQQDLFKSVLSDQAKTKLVSVNKTKMKDVLLKAFEAGEVSGMSIAKWEQSNYNLGVFNPEELAKIESKIQ